MTKASATTLAAAMALWLSGAAAQSADNPPQPATAQDIQEAGSPAPAPALPPAPSNAAAEAQAATLNTIPVQQQEPAPQMQHLEEVVVTAQRRAENLQSV